MTPSTSDMSSHLHMLLTSHCSVLFGMLSVVAIGTFIARIFYLRGQSPHGLGRTKWIYWPTQICMVLGASLLCLTAQVISRSKNHSPVFIYSCVSMGAAWVCRFYLVVRWSLTQ